ncbi:hypothetical protein THAOC_15865 [Thalassiosira oceanica]|uniref:Uncharacterized protein n=1 Tax=Thalassiosira oceanica TaxID=159749 RepID=K0SBF3_THAOC|nr:hypothetical protein THAOC_15865 [Thalassiosira oceanica]|eukprot:EJK63473.1 hypothetical protein THAOC_15865 [Thalassiosira oceanica]
MERQRIARSGNADLTNRRFSNGYLRPAESQVNYKYVQMDVEALNDGLSPNIHRSMAIRGSIAFRRADHKHYLPQAYILGLGGPARKPKHETKHGRSETGAETELMGSSVEDRRTIEVDVNRPADHDGATPEARNPTAKKLWTILSTSAMMHDVCSNSGAV